MRGTGYLKQQKSVAVVNNKRTFEEYQCINPINYNQAIIFQHQKNGGKGPIKNNSGIKNSATSLSPQLKAKDNNSSQ